MSDAGSGGKIDYELYRYTPSIPAAAVFVVVFAFLSISHLIVLVRHRSYFFIPFLVGLFCKSATLIAVEHN